MPDADLEAAQVPVHRHGLSPPAIPLADILARPRLPAGTIRHSLSHSSGEIENVSGNNLLAVHSRLTGDLNGNRQPMYFVLCLPFAVVLSQLMRDEHGLDIRNLPRDVQGGVRGVIAQTVLYTWDGETVLAYSPHNDICWEMVVGTTHELIRKEAAFQLLGPNKGFDPIVPYHVNWGYAPPQQLEAWREAGFLSAAEAIQRFRLLPPAEKGPSVQRWLRFYKPQELVASAVRTGMLSEPESLALLSGAVDPGEIRAAYRQLSAPLEAGP